MQLAFKISVPTSQKTLLLYHEFQPFNAIKGNSGNYVKHVLSVTQLVKIDATQAKCSRYSD